MRFAKDDSQIFLEVRKKPNEVRDKVHKMILDQSIDEKLLSMYGFVFSLEKALIKKTEDNQAFWRELELNFVQRFQEDTEADFNFKIPLDILSNYFSIIKNLNGTEQCQFPLTP